MIFRQLFEQESSTWTYLVAARPGGRALLIDPVDSQADMYLQLIGQLGLKLEYAIDTHTHADHVTALGVLHDRTGCVTVMGEHTAAECIGRRIADGEVIDCDGLQLQALFTPGHTSESFSFRLTDRVFTGDVLLYRGTGRTDFQSGDPHRSWDSIVNRLFRLPDETLVYAAHDYKGWTVSTIGEERRFNPRLAGKSEDEYVQIMRNLNLPRPKMMDIAIAANLACGKRRPP
ncbi:MAG: MBL fold metallo-hydrolase [Gammaproteobacteria bacterium]|nr:MAG: MBL fold metallo-hydrolase [Gammaproteobacteria bacterium]